jgi:proline iminopeptidase
MKLTIFILINVLISPGIFCQNDEYIKSGKNLIHITTYGEGDPLLIINGGPGMNSNGFKALAEILGKSNRAILYDQRGTGKSLIPNIDSNTITLDSMINDIEIIRNHLKIESWIVLGHSFGGMLGSYYASKFPERTKGLILSSSGGINMDLFSRINITSRLSQIEQDSLNYWNAKIANGDTTYAARFQRGMFLAPAYLFYKSHVPVVAERLTQGNLKINRLVYQNMRRINFDCSAGLKDVKVPVLIIQGEQDLIDKKTAMTAMKVLSNSTLVILKNCGHYGWLDQPEQYFKSIHEYLMLLKT